MKPRSLAPPSPPLAIRGTTDMTPQDIDRILQEGIDAVKHGQTEQAIQLLIEVVNADENNEQGWLWLSYVVNDPQDKITALENVLTINPNHRVAQQNLARWQIQLTLLRRARRTRHAQMPGVWTQVILEAYPLLKAHIVHAA
ncbi:MAG: hypothetical protein HY740_02165 [Chloroflexi bacterium]|nr:hypothetical protein [Chloroflexota bacterium]